MSVNNIEVCPHCDKKMDLKNAPYKQNGEYIGDFEAYVCPSCGRVYYTDKGYAEMSPFLMRKK